jgi:hypothetical protein
MITPSWCQQIDAAAQAGATTITFDDGYFNNMLALDVLNQFRVPLTSFLCPLTMCNNKAFWWGCLQPRADAQRRQSGPVRDRATAMLTPKRLMPRLVERFGQAVSAQRRH